MHEENALSVKIPELINEIISENYGRTLRVAKLGQN